MDPASERPIADDLHQLSPREILARFEDQDRALSHSLHAATDEILALATHMAAALRDAGRIISIGAGTSGRLAAVDAAEWPPTFGIEPGRVLAVMAGGETAFFQAVEGAEDREDLGRADLSALEPTSADLIVGVSASGGARYVHAALREAREAGSRRAFITAHPGALAPLEDPDLTIVDLRTGPEVLAGSTRLQAATATQRVFQRASNLCAVDLGWIYSGRMVEMRPTNEKLRRRAIRIVADLGAVNADTAEALLRECEDDIKKALVCARHRVDPAEASARLAPVERRLTDLEGF